MATSQPFYMMNNVKWIVHLNVVESFDLIAGDRNGTTAPYVYFEVGGGKYHTTVKKKSLTARKHAVWNQFFKFTPNNINKPLTLQMFDKDRLKRDDFIGRVQIDMRKLKVEEWTDMMLSLAEVETGKLHIRMTVSQSQYVHPPPETTKQDGLAAVVPPEWLQIFQKAGVTVSDLSDPGTRDAILSVILQPPQTTAPKPPTAAPKPELGTAPSPPPALPPREPSGLILNATTVTVAAPPPPPPPPAAPIVNVTVQVTNAPPPPPLARTPSKAAGQIGLLDEIKTGTKLKHVETLSAPAPKVGTTEGDALVSALSGFLSSRRQSLGEDDGGEDDNEAWSD